ncbi:unnamed protein product [Gordionus sp. m RMFG-2023]
MDNLFSSYNLAVALKDNGFIMSGIIRSNRLLGCHLVDDKILKKKKRGSLDYKVDSNNNIIICKWFDNKSVITISSFMGINPTSRTKRWSVSEKSFINVEIPAIIQDYNAGMGGVNLHMLIELYSDIKWKRFYMRIFFHLLDSCVMNSWLLYRCHIKQKDDKYISLLSFKARIIKRLMMVGKENYGKEDIRFDKIGHWPSAANRQRCKNGYTSNCFISYHSK